MGNVQCRNQGSGPDQICQDSDQDTAKDLMGTFPVLETDPGTCHLGIFPDKHQ